jgi:translation initiation factor 5A
MDVKITSVGSLKQGNYIILDNTPCKVKSIQTSRPGKHGHAKCRIEAVALVGSQKKVVVMPGHDKIDVPIIEKKSAQVLSITENSANVMDSETFENFDLDIPEKLKGTVNEGDQVQYWILMGQKVLRGK